MAPAEASSDSTKVVFPEPPGPTSTTLRIRSGLLAPRSCPAGLRVFPLSAIEDHLSINVQSPRQLLLKRFRKGSVRWLRCEERQRRALKPTSPPGWFRGSGLAALAPQPP